MANFAFSPSTNAPFQFVPTLDGQQYLCTVVWNVFGQRWYIRLSTLQGNLVLYKARVESPDTSDINLLFGYFTSTMVFRDSTQTFEVLP